MNIGEGDAAEKAVRMMLSSGEVAAGLTGSALKNGITLLLAVYKKPQEGIWQNELREAPQGNPQCPHVSHDSAAIPAVP